MLTEQELTTLLNRPLTSIEVTNLELYLEITLERIAQLLCINFTKETATRTYDVRIGYRTVNTDVFTGTPVVSVNGVVQDAATYSVRQFDNQNGTWFNSIVFKRHLPRTADSITVLADWGFDTLPADLRMFVASMFAQVSATDSSASPAVKSKKIEDFTVTFADAPAYDTFILSNAPVIRKYSMCSLGEIRHGSVYPICEY